MKFCIKCNKEHDGSFGSGKFCSRKCSNSRIQTEELKLKKSISAKNSDKVKEANKKERTRHKKDTTTICLHCNKEIFHKAYNKRKYHKECWDKCSGGFRENSTIKHREIYNGFQMDSGAEKTFAVLLDKNYINWIKNNKTFFNYIDKKGKQRKYYPDFYLTDYNYWVEIKGKFYSNENDELKLKAVGDNIELIWSSKIYLPKVINEKNDKSI